MANTRIVGGDADERSDFPGAADASSVPPPPEFGLVLDAPPPRVPGQRAFTPMPMPHDPPARRRPWLLVAAGLAVAAGVVGFVLGDLGGRDEQAGDAAPAAPSAAVPVAAPASPAPAPASVTPASGSTPPPPDDAAGSPPAPAVPADPCPSGMAHVTGGKLYMGTDRDVPVLAPARPAHQVEVQPYCIDVHEVTVAEYRECSDLGECKRAHRTSEWPQPDHEGGDDEGSDGEETTRDPSQAAYDELCNESYDDRGDHPVNCVTWQQARHFCEQRGARLPTEAEWELAARGSDGRVYPWGDDEPDAVHMNGCGAECRTWRAARSLDETPVLYEASDRYPGTAPVGSFEAGRTQWGLYDMVGNVFEWTADRYAPYPGAPEPAEAEAEAQPEQVEGRRVIRGGAFNSFLADHADPALRFSQDERAHTHGIGFRCAADVRP